MTNAVFDINIKENFHIINATKIQRSLAMLQKETIKYQPNQHLLQFFIQARRQVIKDNTTYPLQAHTIMFSAKNHAYLAPPPSSQTIAYNIVFDNDEHLWKNKDVLTLLIPFVVDGKSHPSLEYLFKEIVSTYNQNTMTSSYMAHLLLKQLLIQLNQLNFTQATKLVTTPSTNKISIALDYIHNNQHQTISTQDLLDECKLARSTFDRQFRQQTGKSPNQYIQEYKINSACEILRLSPDTKINQLAESLGYCDPYYFSNTFKKVTGMSPMTFKSSF